MASREKKPLVPSKAKQKANNDCSLPSNEIKSRKGKSLSNLKQQQLARDILEAVATGSQLPPKLEASLPRKKVLRNLKHKQKLKVAKANLIKSKVTRKVANRNLCRIPSDIKKSVRTKRIKLSEENSTKASSNKSLEHQINEAEGENIGAEGNRSAKNNLRTKKTKFILKNIGEVESEDILDRDSDSVAGCSTKSSPKLNRKGRSLESLEVSLPRGVKSKFSGFKRNSIKEKDTLIKTEVDIKYTKGRKATRDLDYTSSSNTRVSKSLLDSKSSIDLTIDEVIASMLSDTEIDNQQGIAEKIEGKLTRSKKMLVEENIVSDIEIKKEPDSEEIKITSDGENFETESIQSVSIHLRKRSNVNIINQRSLRNGKLRQSDSVISCDLELKKRRRLNSDDPIGSEVSSADNNIADNNIDSESSFSESSGNDSQTIVTPIKDEMCTSKETLKSFEDSSQIGPEVENNNNGDKGSELGPTLRSKTKAKSGEVEVKNDNIKIEYSRIIPKNMEVQEELKKMSNLDQVRKDNILAKLSDKSKGRRSSLNIDMKKTVNSFYNATDKSDGNPKSQIDQMIENIKLTIAKSIESKIFGPEKGGLGLGKNNFEIPKIEEIIAPLSAESQKLGLEENTGDEDNNKSAPGAKNEMKPDNSDNSIPKVADTAKEIEKLVMGDIELAETHSQNVQENEPSDTSDANSNTHSNVSEVVNIIENEDCKIVVQEEGESNETSNLMKEGVNDVDDADEDQIKILDDGKKVVRKSSRMVDKVSSPESNDNKKLGKAAGKQVAAHKPENCEESSQGCEKSKETGSKSKESFKNESTENKIASEFPVDGAITESKQEETEEGAAKVDATNEDGAKVSTTNEDVETLERISKEVERMVAEDESAHQLRIGADESQNDQESATIKTAPETSSSSSVELAMDAEKTSGGDELENKDEDEKTRVENAKEVERREESVSEIVKKDKNDCEILINLDSNSKCNLTVPNSGCNPLQEELKKDSNENEKEDKFNEENDANNDSMQLCDNEIYNNLESDTTKEDKKTSVDTVEEQKSVKDQDTKKRVLRTRDKTRGKFEKGQGSCKEKETVSKARTEEEEKPQNSKEEEDSEEKVQESMTEDTDGDAQNSGEMDPSDLVEPQARTKRSREAKKRKEDQLNMLKNKRAKREIRRCDQQNKEETLLDNEVAKINENNRSFLNKYENGVECATNFRGFSEGGRDSLEKHEKAADNVRSKSENDLIIGKENGRKTCENRLSRNLSENHVTKEVENMDMLDVDCKPIKTPETSQKDSDETSTSGESSSSVNITPKILETPEDKAKKESILRLLGLESLEKAAERLNHQKAKKGQSTGTLKTVIRVQKEREKDKRRSRSPLKMVLKQGRGDGEGDSPENFYTIQKELGTSGWGDSSSGANRKFSTNHRHSCDEDNEDAAPKDRQSLVIPEKSSSFSIHPGRLCADVCCYCFGKFGSLDTPMHLAQMKSDERRKKILNIERHLTKDSCLCDACYRHVDRKANTSPTNMQTKPQKQHRQLMVSKCSARDCRDAARHHVKRRWLLKIKAGLQKQVDIDWESSQHTSMSFCVSHYSKIERFLTCALCKRRLARNHTHQLANTETDELNQLLGQQGIPVLLSAGTFVCKLCRYFTQLQLKYKDVENMNTNHKSFFKNYRKRILHYHDIEVLENEDEDSSQNNQSKDKDKDKRKKAKCSTQTKTATFKSPDGTINSTFEKSIPESSKNEGINSEMDNENRTVKGNLSDENVVTDVQFLGIENTVEKLKKRKLLDTNPYTTSDTTISCDNPNEVVEILAMDKEVTLTRLPKRPRTNNDITPVVQRLGANPSISVRTLFPGEEEMNLHANIEFTNVREITPQGWEKCATMIQYDRDTKLLWQELQRPYGNQSSFLRHLILLEKYYRSGDLILAPNASRNAINYSTSVQNRLISYEGPEKMDEPIMEPIASEYHNSRRLSGGYVLERDKPPLPTINTPKQLSSSNTAQSIKSSPPRILKLNPGVSIIKKPPPNLQRLNLPSTSTTANGNMKRKDGQKLPTVGGKIFQLSEPDFKRLQNLKKQKQQMITEKQLTNSNGGMNNSNSSQNLKSVTQYQKAQIAAQTQFQKHLRMQQEMLNRQSRSDFEPLICDVRALANENSPTQNLLHNLNLPKSIQVTTKTSNQIPILPKIPKSLTVIPQTVTRPAEK